MAAFRPAAKPQPPTRRQRALAALVFAGVAVALFFTLREAEMAALARRNIPPGCLMELAHMPVKEAQTHGLPLRECARRRVSSENRARLLGRWVYGPQQAPVVGHIALLREARGDGQTLDRIMHVRVEDNYLMLNELTLEGTGCAGGVEDAYVKSDSFGMTVNLTPEALMRFRADPAMEATYQPGDLSTSATACAARLTMIDRRPVMIQLLDKTETPQGRPAVAPEITSRQACFERQVARYAAQGRTTLMFPDDHVTFVRDYVAVCAPKPPPAPPKTKPATRKGR